MNPANVFPLYEGTFSVAEDSIFKRIGRDDPPEKGALKLGINPFLIQDEHRNILFDTGIGDLFGGDTTIETILNNLDEHSVSDYEISDIFISHLHFDHMAGIANRQNGYWELTFPDATVWVSEDGWKQLHTSIADENEEKKDFFHFVDAKANIEFLHDEAEPIPHVSSKTIGGHTEFHQLLMYKNEDSRFLMAGDVIGKRDEINRNFAAKYDYAPKESMKVRNELKTIAYENNFVILAYHDATHPIFKLEDYHEKKGYTITNIS